tara:strand:+ start:396 stop:623 length:228 start_codon:yes stop_codon:yes gene_type:complete
MRTHETCYNDIDQGHVAGYAADGEELWTVNSAESLNPDDDSGQWLWSDETSMDQQWFDTEAAAVRHAKAYTYGGA